MVGYATPMPSPATAHAAYVTSSDTLVNPVATPSVPNATAAAPPITRRDAGTEVTARDCHQLPVDQLTVASVMTRLASAMESPRILVSISGTNPSVAKKEKPSRNPAANAHARLRRDSGESPVTRCRRAGSVS